jgi:hypothetical protein
MGRKAQPSITFLNAPGRAIPPHHAEDSRPKRCLFPALYEGDRGILCTISVLARKASLNAPSRLCTGNPQQSQPFGRSEIERY